MPQLQQGKINSVQRESHESEQPLSHESEHDIMIRAAVLSKAGSTLSRACLERTCRWALALQTPVRTSTEAGPGDGALPLIARSAAKGVGQVLVIQCVSLHSTTKLN
jgi:hypothetical protein